MRTHRGEDVGCGSKPEELRVSKRSLLNTPIADIGADIVFRRFVPQADSCAAASAKRRRNVEAQRLSGLEVDREFVLRRFLHRQVCRPAASEKPLHAAANVRAVGAKPRRVDRDEQTLVCGLSVSNSPTVSSADEGDPQRFSYIRRLM